MIDDDGGYPARGTRRKVGGGDDDCGSGGTEGEGVPFLPTEHERAVAEVTEEKLHDLYADIPFGLPEEPIA